MYTAATLVILGFALLGIGCYQSYYWFMANTYNSGQAANSLRLVAASSSLTTAHTYLGQALTDLKGYSGNQALFQDANNNWDSINNVITSDIAATASMEHSNQLVTPMAQQQFLAHLKDTATTLASTIDNANFCWGMNPNLNPLGYIILFAGPIIVCVITGFMFGIEDVHERKQRTGIRNSY